MYNTNLKIKLDKVIVDALMKNLKFRNLEEYVNEKLKNDLMK